MSDHAQHKPALEPEDLSRFFVERANAGDVDGLVALFEPEAVLAFPAGQITVGSAAIRAVFAEMVARQPTFPSGGEQPALRCGDVALTSTRSQAGGATAEVARRQPDGSWLWVIDQPNIAG